MDRVTIYLINLLRSQIENMRSVSARNINFFNNMKQQIVDACDEATSKLSIKNAINGKVDWDAPKNFDDLK